MKSVKGYVMEYFDVLLFITLVTFKLITFNLALDPNFITYTKAPLFPLFASVLMLASLALFLKKKSRKRLLFILNFIVSLLIIVNLSYYRYFKDMASVSLLSVASQLTSVDNSVKTLLGIGDIFYFIDFIALFPLIKIISKTKHKDELIYNNAVPMKKLRLAAAILFVLSLSLNVTGYTKMSKEQPNLITAQHNKVYIAKNLGMINYHATDLYSYMSGQLYRLTPVSEIKKEEIKTYLESNTSTTGQKLQGAYQGKNLIMIQVEALQQFIIGSQVNGQEVTPNLNALIKDSAYFDNIHYQIAAGGTSDAEFVTNNSLYPDATGVAYSIYAGNTFRSLPQALKSKGYETAVLHANRETFWNRLEMYKTLGYDHFYGEKSYNINEVLGMGLSDKEFLKQSMDKLNNLSQPFYSFLITLTSHHPFDAVKNVSSFDAGQYTGTFMGDYIQSINYTDEQLGMFLKELKDQGYMDNSIIVIYGDHSAMPISQSDALAKFLGKDKLSEPEWAEQQKVPLIIHFPGDKNSGVYSTLGGEIDVTPTLNNLLGLDMNTYLGHDLFNTNDNLVVLRNGSFIDGNIYYSSQYNKYYILDNNSEIKESPELLAKKKQALMELDYSDNILKHNLYKKYDSIKSNSSPQNINN